MLDCIFRLKAAISLRSARPSRPRCACNRDELKASEHCNIAASIISVSILYVYVLLSTLWGDAEAGPAGIVAVTSESLEAEHLVPLFAQRSCAKSADSMAGCVFLQFNGSCLKCTLSTDHGTVGRAVYGCCCTRLTPRQTILSDDCCGDVAAKNKLWSWCTPSASTSRRGWSSQNEESGWNMEARRIGQLML